MDNIVYGIAIIVVLFVLFCVVSYFKCRQPKRKNISCSDMANLIGVMADDRIADLFSLADLSSFGEKDINITKGYFEIYYSVIVMISIRINNTITGDQLMPIARDIVYLSIGMNDMDIGNLVYDDQQTILKNFFYMYHEALFFFKNSDFSNLPEIMRKETNESILNTIVTKVPSKNIISLWLEDASVLSKNFRVIV